MLCAALGLTMALPAPAQQDSSAVATRAVSPPADASAEETRMAIVGEVGKGMSAGQYQRAIDLVAPVIRDYEREQAARTDTLVFSAQSRAQAVLYAVLGAKGKKAALVVGPAYAYAWFMQAYALSELGKPQQAEIAVKHAIALSPMNPQFLGELAMLQQKRGDNAGAMQTYGQVQEFAGFGHEGTENHWKGVALRGQGFILIETGKLDEAGQRYNAALKLDPADAKARNELDYIRDLRAKR